MITQPNCFIGGTGRKGDGCSIDPGSQIPGPDRKTASGIPFTGGTFAGTWTNLGPAPITSDPNQDHGAVVGRVTSIAVDPGDTTGNTVYVGAAALTVTDAAGDAQSISLKGTGTDFNITAGASRASVTINAADRSLQHQLDDAPRQLQRYGEPYVFKRCPTRSKLLVLSICGGERARYADICDAQHIHDSSFGCRARPFSTNHQPATPVVGYFVVLLLMVTVIALLAGSRPRPLPAYLRAMALAGILGSAMLVPACGGGGGGGSNNLDTTPKFEHRNDYRNLHHRCDRNSGKPQ